MVTTKKTDTPSKSNSHARLAETMQMIEEVTSAMLAKKGQRVVVLDLRGIEKAVCDFFVICSADTAPHIKALCDEVEDRVASATGEWPWRSSGHENAQWIVLDYIDVVVHLMTNPTRDFYDLEGLWADAKRTEYKDED